MLAYSLIGVVIFFLQIYLRWKTKDTIHWSESFGGYLTMTAFLSIIWPVTLILIFVRIGVLIGFDKANKIKRG